MKSGMRAYSFRGSVRSNMQSADMGDKMQVSDVLTKHLKHTILNIKRSLQ